ncbi:hypothetical protein LOK82_08910 [Xylella fastidiosa subsp. multiplex]|uniref:Uncharacterized protein n=1 Tax=Xylella fastidiosa subsp. multiplex TaxID=644357 RepID=A0AAW6HVI3_XYLFS|nr:hypothetical protein [Xylella fastidiosa subsp. multiplex]WLE26620.1 hypothetical protein DVS74_007335 [Xylella fastidiosa subsp. multiplex]
MTVINHFGLITGSLSVNDQITNTKNAITKMLESAIQQKPSQEQGKPDKESRFPNKALESTNHS